METTASDGARLSAANLGELLDRFLTEAEIGAEAPPSADKPHENRESPSAEALGGGGGNPLGALLGNPAVLAALPTLAENLGPLLSGRFGGVGSAPTATRPRTLDRHTALLCAVKPYLSPGRQEAAETVIRLCRVWDALERSGISLSGMLAGPGGSAQGGKSDGEVT